MTDEETFTLREYIQDRLQSMETNMHREFEHADRMTKQIAETIDYRFDAIEKSTALATVAIDHRLDGMNEFREQIHQQQLTFITKSEYNAKHEDVIARIDTLTSALRDAREQHYTFFTHSEQEVYAKEIVLRFETAEKARDAIIARVSVLERDYANLQGRIWALGIGMTVLTIAIAAVLHFIPV